MSEVFKPRPLVDERKRLLELLEAAYDERAELRGRIVELERTELVVGELANLRLEPDERTERAANRLRAAWIGASIAGDYGMMLGLGTAFGIAFPDLELEHPDVELET